MLSVRPRAGEGCGACLQEKHAQHEGGTRAFGVRLGIWLLGWARLDAAFCRRLLSCVLLLCCCPDRLSARGLGLGFCCRLPSALRDRGWLAHSRVRSAVSEIESRLSWASRLAAASSTEWTYQQSSKLPTPFDRSRCAQTNPELAMTRPVLAVMICGSP